MDTPKGNSQKQYKTDGGKTKSNAIEIPSVALPKGGGAIKGIDQKFSVNAVNGTAAFSVPLPVSPARGAVPSLSLSYNSGGGNGIFGLGWNLSLPSIKRKTDKELPQYNDYIDSDTYLLSEAEDLVPEFKRNSNGSFVMNGSDYVVKEDSTSFSGFVIRFYRPRVEGLFARIERWTETSTGTIKWRVISRDNTISLYGWTAAARLADPANPKRIFEWLPEMVIDDKGNCAHYFYKPEDAVGIDMNMAHNHNRLKSSAITYTNLYIDKVLYGNKTPYSFGSTFPADSDFLFETAFDYGQYDPWTPFTLKSPADWDFRNDAFSEYKSGFEIRTTRLCKRVLLIHHFTELAAGAAPVLVKSVNFTYTSNGQAGFSFLYSVKQCGYIKLSDGTYSSKNLPRLQFTYQSHQWNKAVKSISAVDLQNAPVGLSEPYQFTDLYNEGLSGILYEHPSTLRQAQGSGGNGAWYYKRNLGAGKFEAAHSVSPKPSFSGLGSSLQLLDLDGDGVKQLVNFNHSPQGFYEVSTGLDRSSTSLGESEAEFQRFKSFVNLPNINLNDGNARLLDLNGDGKTDLLITEDHCFRWYESDGRNGYKDVHTTSYFSTANGTSEEDGPKILFADAKQSIYLADMCGDGLMDIVRIRNGEVCYWPNLGFGRFGNKVSMDNAPVFDSDADYNPAYLKISDIDGSGTPDLIYLGKNKFTCYMNLSGNAFDPTPFEMDAFPAIHNRANVTVTDLLGTGLSCIVWSSALQKDTQAPLYYVDLMNSIKPHIMIKHVNNMGAEVELEYTPSTKYYIDDKLAGKPWITRLHFPVYCVSKVTNRDKVSGHVFVSKYSYHHGYFDHAEKEFRGFGRVDQTDTEDFEHWEKTSATNITDKTLHLAPVLTRSWFHTGASSTSSTSTSSVSASTTVLNQFATEYWYAELNKQFPAYTFILNEYPLPDARIVADIPSVNGALVNNLNPIEKREALRACKSMALRSEVFALDAPAIAPSTAQLQDQLKPYSVGTHNCVIELVQPKGSNKHAVYCVKESEAITYSYERNLADPRIAHNLNLELDEYGNVLKSAAVVYPRLAAIQSQSFFTALPAATQNAQKKTSIVFTDNSFTNDVSGASTHRLRLPSEAKTYELTAAAKSGNIYTIAELLSAYTGATQINYETAASTASTPPTEKRMIEHVQSLYYKDDLTGPKALHQLDAIGLPYESYQHAYTASLLTTIFTKGSTQLVGSTEMAAGNFYQPASSTDWWIRSGTVQYIDTGLSTPETAATAAARFFVPISFTDPYGSKTKVKYDAAYKLFIEETSDALNNKASVVKFDYRTLSPVRMKDANDNESEVLLDELGLPKAMALFGKGTEGDYLTGLTAETLFQERVDISNYFASAKSAITNSTLLQSAANTLLQQATARFVYDFDTQPTSVSTILREEHYSINSSAPLQIAFEYSDGFNRVVMKKVQAEPGLAMCVVPSSASGTSVAISTINTADGSSSLGVPSLRWIGNGKTVLNNKGKAVKQYEPYFSVTANYENFKELVEQGVTPILYYDAMGRNTKTEYPDGTSSKVEFDSWKQTVYDQNDLCAGAGYAWYDAMTGSGSTAQQQDAAAKALAHYNTPTTSHSDTLGRAILLEETLYVGSTFTTHRTQSEIDIEGNLRSVTDARNNVVMRYKYDLLGNMVYQNSMDSGQRWLLHNCVGSPLRTWDERNHELQFTYDALHRPLTVKTIGGDGPSTGSGPALNNIVDNYIYGEGQSNDKANNLRGQLYQHYDTGGLEQTAAYDFKGHALSSERWLAKDYKNVVNWATLPTWPLNSGSVLEMSSYTIASSFDALGRIKLQTAPNNNTIYPVYSERGVLKSEKVKDGNASTAVTRLANIEYDAKGQRTKVEYGNGTKTTYTYDSKTFRLTRLYTTDGNNVTLQDLNYWYDAVGNITWKKDNCVPTQFYKNQMVTGDNKFTYDALYRLLTATGRENDAAVNFTSADNTDDSPFILKHGANDAMNMQNYTQNYNYDAVGNILQLQHSAAQGSYTRNYTYNSSNNRLLTTQIGSNTPYSYNHHAQHGYLTSLPHLSVLNWNFKEEVVATSKQTVNSGTPETTYYQYDSKGKRLRKVTENASTSSTFTKKDSRVYIEGYEFYENFSGTAYVTHCLSLIDSGQRFVMIESTTNPALAGYLVRYQHPNHQSSSTLETDDSGAVISYEEYHPFGTTSYQAMEKPIRAAAKRYRYTGMERDDETGLSYHNARYYISWLGRWLSPDPIGIGDGVNVYAYCGGNPVNGTDTGGTQMTNDVAKKLPVNGFPSSSHTPPDLSIKSTAGQINGAVPNGMASTSTGVTAQYSKPVPHEKNPQSQANNSSASLAATGNGASSAGAAHYKKGTEQMQTAAALNKVFAANGIGSKPEEESNSGTKLGGMLQAGGGVAGMIGSLLLASTGVGFLLAAALFAYNLDTTVAGLQQAQTGLETQTIFDQKLGSGLQGIGFSKSEAAFGTSVLDTGIGLLSGSGGMLKVEAAAVKGEEMFRKTANTGVFSELEVPMQMRYVKQYAEQGGVGLQGVKIKILRDPELLRFNAAGSTSGKTIYLYPNAFQNPEELIRTLGHERTHIMQFSIFGASEVNNNVKLFEDAAYGIEDSFIKYWKSNTGQ